MADDIKSRAGFFSLCLNAARNPKPKHLSYRIAVTDKLLQDFSCLNMSTNAVLNLKGVFKFYCIDQLKTAIDCFKQVLEANRNDKNAIAHMLTVYQRLHMNSKAKQYKEMQAYFEEQRRTRGPLNEECVYCSEDVEQGNFLFEYFDAEALAEQGIAFFMDCYTEEDEWVRNDRSLKLFDDCLKTINTIKNLKLQDQTRNCMEQLELEVKYWVSQCYQKVHQGVIRRDSNMQQPGCRDSYCEGIRLLWDIIKSEKALPDLKAWAWAYLGVFCFKKPKNLRGKKLEDVETFVTSLGLKEAFHDPDICFKNALKIEQEGHRSTETRIRYATYLRTLNNRDKIEHAIILLEDAWKLCENEGNWFAKTMLAQVHMSMYRLLKGGKNRGAEDSLLEDESVRYLNQAIKYGEEALLINTTAMDLANVAEAYYLRGLKSDGTLDGDSDDALQAAEYFWQAVQCLGTEKKPEIHKKHGLFLKAIGEDRQAIECFKRGMEVSVPTRPADNFDKLFETFLEMYSKEREVDKPGPNGDDVSSQQTEIGAEPYGRLPQGATADKRKKQFQEVPGDSEKEQVQKKENETFSSVASSKSTPGIIDDLELDHGLPSHEERVMSEEHVSKTNQEHEQSKETWKHKQNEILYEMSYWYQYAVRNFSRDCLTRRTSEYIEKFPEEMSMMQAYFKLDTDSEERNSKYVEVIEEALKIRMHTEHKKESTQQEQKCEKQTGYETQMDHAKVSEKGDNKPIRKIDLQKDFRKKTDHAKKMLFCKMKEQKASESELQHCKHCSQPLSLISRQTSVIPDAVPRPRNTYYKYDFYVIFNRSERDWVYYSLLQKLEKSYQFKGAIPERDYRLGHNNFVEMERCIKQSLKVLIILSSHVTKKEEIKSNYEIDFALTVHHDMARSHYIVPVLKDKDCLPPRQLSTLTCVNAVHSNAWEKIVLALETNQ